MSTPHIRCIRVRFLTLTLSVQISTRRLCGQSAILQVECAIVSAFREWAAEEFQITEAKDIVDSGIFSETEIVQNLSCNDTLAQIHNEVPARERTEINMSAHHCRTSCKLSTGYQDHFQSPRHWPHNNGSLPQPSWEQAKTALQIVAKNRAVFTPYAGNARSVRNTVFDPSEVFVQKLQMLSHRQRPLQLRLTNGTCRKPGWWATSSAESQPGQPQCSRCTVGQTAHIGDLLIRVAEHPQERLPWQTRRCHVTDNMTQTISRDPATTDVSHSQ